MIEDDTIKEEENVEKNDNGVVIPLTEEEPEEEDNEFCENCASFVAYSDCEGTGECQAHPPSFKNSGSETDDFPRVNKKDWCGEFNER